MTATEGSEMRDMERREKNMDYIAKEAGWLELREMWNWMTFEGVEECDLERGSKLIDRRERKWMEKTMETGERRLEAKGWV